MRHRNGGSPGNEQDDWGANKRGAEGGRVVLRQRRCLILGDKRRRSARGEGGRGGAWDGSCEEWWGNGERAWDVGANLGPDSGRSYQAKRKARGG